MTLACHIWPARARTANSGVGGVVAQDHSAVVASTVTQVRLDNADQFIAIYQLLLINDVKNAAEALIRAAAESVAEYGPPALLSQMADAP